MFIAPTEFTIFCDVDDTLIHWESGFLQPHEGAVKVVCPHDGSVTYHRPHKRHVGYLKKQKAKGYTIIIWSAAGVGWAKAVIDALELEPYVDIVVSKPNKCIDDLKSAEDIIGKVFYLDDDGFSV